jgi:hypothetical protein
MPLPSKFKVSPRQTFPLAGTPAIAAVGKLSLSVKSRPANGTFGFFRHTSQRSKKPKEPFFSNARQNNPKLFITFDQI